MKKIFLLAALISLHNIIFAAPSGDTTIIEINDTTMSTVYYHQTNFATPTKLVFKNLTTVNGQIYFHQTVNLVGVEFPLLQTVHGYFYFHGNTAIKKINAPLLNSVNDYLYINGNTALVQLNVCNLQQIIPDQMQPKDIYYFINNNNPLIDAAPFCFSKGTPTNLTLSNNSINENLPESTVIGKLSATSNDQLKWYISSFGNDFTIRNDTLFASRTFDYETQTTYDITVEAINRLGEKTQADFTININNIAGEDTAVIEIDDTTMSEIYYHQISFAAPTKLVFKNLTTVNGKVYFHQNVNLISVDFPLLQSCNEYFYFHQNLALERINAPALTTVHDYLYVNGNSALTTLNVCNLQQIIPDQMKPSETYYYIHNNTPVVDAMPFCFAIGAPTDLHLSLDTVYENRPINTVVGKLSAAVNLNNTLNWNLPSFANDNDKFIIRHDTLFTATTFDYEAKHNYTITAEASNQLGEKTSADFAIQIVNILVEDTVTIEITDTTMTNVYYHQYSFSTPTRLVFKNLASVTGYVYFHQNTNLISVDFPLLQTTGSYFYFHSNQSLLKINAPNLSAVKNYLYVYGNTMLTELNVCNLKQIFPGDATNDPYYFIYNNDNIDFTTTCMTRTYVIFVPVTTIIPQPAPNTYIGHFISDADTTKNTVRYFFVDANGNETTNDNFIIRKDSVFLAHEYNTYTDSSFTLAINAIRVSKSLNRPLGPTGSLNEKISLTVKANLSNNIRYSNTWIGACTSVATSAWENPANWSSNILPDAYTDVNISNGNITIGTNAICRSLRLSSNAHVTVKTGVKLTIIK